MPFEHACPGCGAAFPDVDGPTHRYMESSPACWAAYGEVLAREYGDGLLLEVHRLSVDAYAVQHPGRPTPQCIHSVGLHLARLFLLLELGLRAEAANAAMLELGLRKRSFTWLEPPASRGALTVASVVGRTETEEHKAAVRAWARSALDAWSAHWPTLETWTAELRR